MSISHHDYINEYLEYLTYQKRYSAHTILSYKNDLNDFASYLQNEYGDEISIHQSDTLMVRGWMAHMVEKKFTPRTVNRKISALKSFFKYQMRVNGLSVNPVADKKSLKVSRRLPVFLEEKVMDQLLENENDNSDWKEVLAHTILVIFYQTGLRLSELMNLKETDIDASACTIKVLGKGNKERIIPIGNDFLREIENYLNAKKTQFPQSTSEILLVRENGKPLYPKYIYNIVKDKLGEVSTIQRKSPHVLRHTFATHLTNNGAPINAVKELLGHSSLAATQIYTHNSIDQLKEIYKRAHPKG